MKHTNMLGWAAIALAAAMALAAVAGCARPETVADFDPGTGPKAMPPIADTRPYRVESPNGSREDEYYWLRDDTRKDPAMLAYLRAENRYRDAVLAPTKPLQKTLFDEIVGRIEPDDSSVPFRYRGYSYARRFAKGMEYPIYTRQRIGVDGAEQVLLDGNRLARGHDYFEIGAWAVPPSGKRLAWAEDTVGRRQYTIRFKNPDTGEVLPDTLPGNTASITWAADDRTAFYIEKDPVTLLGVRVKKHRLGTDPTEDPLVYEERDASCYLSVSRTSDDRYVVIRSSSTVSDEVRFLPADRPDEPLQVLVPRERGHEYSTDHTGNRWILRTNHRARNFRIVSLADDKVGDKAAFEELVSHRPGILVENFAPFRDYLVIEERGAGARHVRVLPWAHTGSDAPGEGYLLEFDEAACAASIDVNREQDTASLRFSYVALNTPDTTYEIDMLTRKRKLLKRDPVPGGFELENYATERVWARARDGAKIPISLVHRKGYERNGTAPLYLYAYGSYGSSRDPSFRSPIVSLLDRGFVFAIAHVRGGQEMGREWYDDGKLLKKQNTFTDFIDATEHLVREKYGAPDKVVVMGGSAGGLLIGAVVNMRPDLYRCAVAHVPFVDIVTTMLDESIPLTTNEFDEWGNPKAKPYYDYMLSYSPYDNVERKDYPAMLVTTGLWDSQVQYFEPAKWVARLRARKTDDQVLVLHTNMEAGHGGKSGRFRRQQERALEYAFVLDQLGMRE